MHPGELAEMAYLQQLADKLRRAPHGTQGALIDQGAAFLGVSRQTLYTRLRGAGYTSGRKLRADKGDSRVSIDEVKTVAAILQASRRQTGKALLPVADAIDIAEANGKLTTRVSPQTMLRIMRRNGCHPQQLQQATPHAQMRSLHPNHVWQLDASICVLYYLRNGRVGVMDERQFNARKPAELAKVLNQRVLRYALTDHYSGHVSARYFQTSGEDQLTLFEFLMHAMQPQAGRVAHGVPWMMVWDAGSANQSHAIGNLLTQLAVRHWAHVPGNARAKGQVESVHNVIERKFEGRLTFTRVDSVEQLNGHLDKWLLALNGSAIHSRHGHTRSAMWQTIRADQLRLCPALDTCSVLMTSKPEQRTVNGALAITYKPRGAERSTYSVAHIPGVRVRETVTLVVNPYRSPNVFVIAPDENGESRYWECTPLETDAAGFILAGSGVFGESYASKPDTTADAARKDAYEAAYGERDTLDALAAKQKGAVAFGGEIDPFADLPAKVAATPTYLQRRGTELHVPNPLQIEIKPLSLVEALFELRARLDRTLEAHEAAAVRTWFPDGVPAEELDGLVARINQLSAAGAQPVSEMPRLVAVK